MAKQGGLGQAAYIGGTDVGGDVAALTNVRGGPTVLDLTDITQFAHERAGGPRDGELAGDVWFNPTRIHPVLSALPTTDVIVTWAMGTALGDPAAAINGKQVNYDGKRASDGSFPLSVQVLANSFGLEWGVQLTAGVRTDTGATNGTAVDFTTVSTAFGLQAYLQVAAFTGTDVTVKIQDAALVGGPYADLAGAAFTQITGGAPRAERIQTARGATVRQFLRAVTVTTGGFANLQFSVVVVRNSTSVVF